MQKSRMQATHCGYGYIVLYMTNLVKFHHMYKYPYNLGHFVWNARIETLKNPLSKPQYKPRKYYF